MNELREAYENEVATFVYKATKEGYGADIDGMSAYEVIEATDKVRERLIEAFGDVVDVPDEFLERKVAEGRKYLVLFSIPGKYDISTRGEVTPLNTLMHVMVDSENDGLLNTDTFAYAMQETAHSVYHALRAVDCQDPEFLKQKAQYDAHQEKERMTLAEVMEALGL